MPATASVQHLTARSERRMVDYDADDQLNIVDLGQPQDASAKCLAIDVYRRFLAGLFRSVGTGSVTKFEIVAATSAAGANAAVVKSHAIGSAPNAVGDTIWLECDVDQVREVLAAATHVGVRVQLATASDEGVVAFERADPFYVTPNQTADFIS
jgi:hypothetical protein